MSKIVVIADTIWEDEFQKKIEDKLIGGKE